MYKDSRLYTIIRLIFIDFVTEKRRILLVRPFSCFPNLYKCKNLYICKCGDMNNRVSTRNRIEFVILNI